MAPAERAEGLQPQRQRTGGMTLDIASAGLGLCASALVAYAWLVGRQGAIRDCRRIVRHGRNLDLVFFEDAERDTTIERPKPAAGDVAPFGRQSER